MPTDSRQVTSKSSMPSQSRGAGLPSSDTNLIGSLAFTHLMSKRSARLWPCSRSLRPNGRRTTCLAGEFMTERLDARIAIHCAAAAKQWIGAAVEGPLRQSTILVLLAAPLHGQPELLQEPSDGPVAPASELQPHVERPDKPTLLLERPRRTPNVLNGDSLRPGLLLGRTLLHFSCSQTWLQSAGVCRPCHV